MQGYARALLEDCAEKLGPEYCGYLERIVRGAGRLDRLTLDVLAYSRLSRSEMELQEIDLNKLLLDIIEQYPQFEAAKSHIKIESPLLPVLGHPAFLTQCIFNLIGNGLKFVEPGKNPEVTIFTTRKGNKVELSVKDNGIGISSEHRGRAFQMFGRIHNDKIYEGTGIGLAVVKRAVSRMGGHVDFESEVGKGSRFWIELSGTTQQITNQAHG
jgi:signal transduction histidine kinase